MAKRRKYIDRERRLQIAREIAKNYKEGNQTLGFYVWAAINDNFKEVHDNYKKAFFPELFEEARNILSKERREAIEWDRALKEIDEADKKFEDEFEMVKRMKELRANNDPQYMKKDLDDEYAYLDKINMKESEKRKTLINYPEYFKKPRKKRDDNDESQFKISFR